MRNPEGIFLTDNLESLKNFNKSQYKLGIVERNALTGGDEFFNELMKKPFQVSGAVRKLFAKSDIAKLLENTLDIHLFMISKKEEKFFYKKEFEFCWI